MSPQNNTCPSRPPKTIVLAFDGTAKKFSACNTNVIRLFSLLEKEKPEEQMVYYQPGLGTYLASEAAWSPTEKAVSELMDKAFARYLDVHIMDGYRYLMANYKRNDRVGLLLPGTDQMVASAYERYLDLSPGGDQLASNFKDAFSIDCPIEFLGLWDTVSSVGIVNSKHLPFTASNSQVKTVRHALSLDEHRAKFKPNRWHQSSSACQETGRWRPSKRTFTLWSVPPEDRKAVDPASLRRCDRVAENSHAASSTETNQATNVMEVWFAGDHSDVGGGRKAEENRPSNPSLAWMISQIILSKAPILFKRKEQLKLPAGFGFASTTSEARPEPQNSASSGVNNAAGDVSGEGITCASPVSLFGSGSHPTRERFLVPGGARSNLEETTVPIHEEIKNLQQLDKGEDARSPIHDSMTKTWLWRPLEYLPFRHSTGYDGTTGWSQSIMPNLGRGRKITTHHVYIHESVWLRMKDATGYAPKAEFVGDRPDILFVNNSDEAVGKGVLQATRLLRVDEMTPLYHFRLSSSTSF